MDINASKSREAITKMEIARKLDVSRKTLAVYCNIRYFDELEKLGYKKNQKKLTPLQVHFLQEKLGF